MITPRTAIGIDLGGTEVKGIALTYPDGKILAQEQRPTQDGAFEGKIPVFAKHVADLVARFEDGVGEAITCIGLSAPGLATPEGDAIGFIPQRMVGLENLHWQSLLKRSHPIRVLNDAHAALLGEIWLGAAKDLRDVVMYTLGTGVGGAIVSGGHLLQGHYRRAGHLGHMTVHFKGDPDTCNTPGSIEDAIGEMTLVQRSRGRFTTTAALVENYAKGDPMARTLWLESLRALAASIVSTANAVDPEVFLLGGGIASAGPHLFEPLKEFVRAFEWRPANAHIVLRPAGLGPLAGAYGAAYHAATLSSSQNHD